MAWTPLRFITRSSHPPHDPIHHATVEYAAVSSRRVGARDNKSAGRLISEVNNAIPDLAVVLQVPQHLPHLIGDRHRSILPVPVVCEELSAQSDRIGAVPGASHNRRGSTPAAIFQRAQ